MGDENDKEEEDIKERRIKIEEEVKEEDKECEAVEEEENIDTKKEKSVREGK